MKRIRVNISLLIVALSVTFGNAFAHQDFFVAKDFGNVKVRIKTGYEYEEINKVAIFGQLAEKLAKDLKCSESIFLDFNHHYTGNCTPDYFISYEDIIVIRQVARQFQSHTTLKLLEYAILNLKNIKSTQTQIEYNKNYCNWKINSIDTFAIKKMLQTPNSDFLNNMLNIKVYRPEENFEYGISYYWQNNRYFIFQKSFFNKQESVITDFENIYDFKKTGNLSAIIFETDSSFYYVAQSGYVHFGVGGTGDQQNKPQISKRQIIENEVGYRPFTIVGIGGGKIVISFSHWAEWKDDENSEFTMIGQKERTLIYLTKEDKLIQDLDKLLKMLDK